MDEVNTIFKSYLNIFYPQGIDASAMGRILCGLVQSGAWGCFDEFNRLDEATLSTISMYIQAIQNALLGQHTVVNFLNQEVYNK